MPLTKPGAEEYFLAGWLLVELKNAVLSPGDNLICNFLCLLLRQLSPDQFERGSALIINRDRFVRRIVYELAVGPYKTCGALLQQAGEIHLAVARQRP